MIEADDELSGLIAEAEMGEKAREFLTGDLGRTMLGMAEQDAQAAKDALADAPPEDAAKIRELQTKAALARLFSAYLAELVSRGNEAVNALRENQRSMTP